MDARWRISDISRHEQKNRGQKFRMYKFNNIFAIHDFDTFSSSNVFWGMTRCSEILWHSLRSINIIPVGEMLITLQITKCFRNTENHTMALVILFMYGLLSARQQYLQCVSNWKNAVLHIYIYILLKIDLKIKRVLSWEGSMMIYDSWQQYTQTYFGNYWSSTTEVSSEVGISKPLSNNYYFNTFR